MRKALIVSSTAGFAKGFLLHDMLLLQKMGFEVHCAANSKGIVTFNVDEFFLAKGVIYHQVDFSSSSPISKQSFIAYRQIKRLLKENFYEVIHCHTPIVSAIVRVAALYYRNKGSKIIYTTHGLAFPKGSSIKNKLIYGLTEWLCSCISDAIITINWEDYATVKKMKCKKVYHINGVGVDTNIYHNVNIDHNEYRKKIGIKNDDLMVLSVGELSLRKNQQIIIKALSEIGDPHYVFVICGKAMVGEGTTDLLQKLAHDLNVRLILLGFRRDIPEITHCADIVVLPSLREGLGLAGIEALASGVPVVGSNVQGIKDYVINGKTGYLCNPMDAHAFAEKIQLLSDMKIRNSMSKSCVEKAEEFRTQVSWDQMEKIYKEIINTK
ncbi:glycosyltransferase involved in cell wall biosynthesis [Catenibacillus scindens]|uniref:Glycosyltransferase involved in cell wall biosynthesis n=1 Tax=Catenibacillus scindens TaxID=673271 RepID=A0A7W8HAL5_9FIRM|nr:glycosyltransferase [Catenibacillus scindens]MBB5264177.1 glycosyltransferase involved in cell wall biosynthesis [Catenibacillus scindens]